MFPIFRHNDGAEIQAATNKLKTSEKPIQTYVQTIRAIATDVDTALQKLFDDYKKLCESIFH